MPHLRKLIVAAFVGATCPFLIGAVGADNLSFTEMVLAALAPLLLLAIGLVAKAAGAALVAYGSRLLKDKDRKNDALGDAAVAAGRALGKSTEK